MYHSFNTAIAAKYGIAAAVVFEQIYEGISLAKEKNENRVYDKFWYRMSASLLAKKLGYMTARQVSYALNKLLEGGAIEERRLNQSFFDQTAWYTITEYGSNKGETKNEQRAGK